MINSENFTNRELLDKAMPLTNFTKEQWKVFLKHIELLEVLENPESELLKVLEIVFENQSKIAILENYNYYYNNTLEKPVA